jgi:hypothetical protein
MWLGPCNWFLVGVAVGLGLQVVGDTSVESRDLDKVGHHPDDGAALRVGDRVENLCDFVRIVDRDGDGMWGFWDFQRTDFSFKKYLVHIEFLNIYEIKT